MTNTPKKNSFEANPKFWKLYLWFLGIEALILGTGLYCMSTIKENNESDCFYRADWAIATELLLTGGLWSFVIMVQHMRLSTRTMSRLSLGPIFVILGSSVNYLAAFPLMVLMQIHCRSVKTAALVVYWIMQIIGLLLFIFASLLAYLGRDQLRRSIARLSNSGFKERINAACGEVTTQLFSKKIDIKSFERYVENHFNFFSLDSFKKLDVFAMSIYFYNFKTVFKPITLKHKPESEESKVQIKDDQVPILTDCKICLSSLMPKQTTLLLFCCQNHLHLSCGRQYFSGSNCCPICLAPLADYLMHELKKNLIGCASIKSG